MSRVRRKRDWVPRLEAAIKAAAARPFAWGRHDCCTFAAGCVVAMTDGPDPMEKYRGGYDDEKGATRILRRCGLAGRGDSVLDALGVEVAPGLAQRGAVVLVEGAGGAGLGVVDLTGRRVVLLEGEGHTGIWRVPLSMVTRAWRVG